MAQVKLSVSLSEKDVATLDKYARAVGLKSRSAAIQQAIKLLADAEIEEARRIGSSDPALLYLPPEARAP